MGNKQDRQTKLSEQLIRAIQDRAKSSDDIEKIIRKGADVNRPHDGSLPLYWVCRYKGVQFINCLRLLLEHGAKVNTVDDEGNTALHCVVKRYSSKSYNEFVKVLIQYGADVNKRNKYGYTPLMCVDWANNQECVKFLLCHGADINTRGGGANNYTPLQYAVHHNKIDLVKFLLKHGADANIPYMYYSTILHFATYNCTTEYVELLLQHGARVNARDDVNDTPLHNAVRANKVLCIRLLLQHGADVNVGETDYRTPLQLAVRANKVECGELLLQYGANADTLDEINRTPLHMGLNTCNTVQWIKLLLQHGVNVDAKDKNHNTVLSKAASHCQLEIIEILLDYSANVNNINLEDQTPLMLAAVEFKKLNTERSKACLELLIQASGQFDLSNELIQDIVCDAKLSEILLPYCLYPRSLQELCRYQIRSSLRNQFLPDVIPSLNLPPSLQRFVLLQRVTG